MWLTINPLFAIAWRGPGRVQIGLDPGSAFILDGVTPAEERLLEALTRGVDDRGLRRLGRKLGLDARQVGAFVDLLADQGALLQEAPDALPRQAWAVAATAGTQPGWDVVRRRQAARVLVVGAGGQGGRDVITTLLEEGVGQVLVRDDRQVRAEDVASGVFDQAHVGRSRAQALARELPVLVADDTTPRPSAAIVVADRAGAPWQYDPLLREDVPHTTLQLRERTALVGPFVLPGRTCCQRCVEMYRADRDPQWPLVLAQVSDQDIRRHDRLLVALAARVACAELLVCLDGGTPVSAATSLEVSLTDPVPRTRSWPAHPRCGCTLTQLNGPLPEGVTPLHPAARADDAG